MRLYLASTSPARLMLLRQLGIEPVVVPSELDEPAAVARAEQASGPLSAEAMVMLLAQLKAEAIGTRLPDGEPITGIVVGGDSAFDIDGAIHGKPHTSEVAIARWKAQRGKSGVLHSGHWFIHLVDGVVQNSFGAADKATVHFASDISDAEVSAYVATGEPLSVAGAFTIDGLAAPFISRIEGAPSAVIGMSLPVLRQGLSELGVNWFDLREPA